MTDGSRFHANDSNAIFVPSGDHDGGPTESGRFANPASGCGLPVGAVTMTGAEFVARGIAFFPTGSPTYDYYGADRPGANLYGNSLVVLDAWLRNVHDDVQRDTSPSTRSATRAQ